MQKSACRTGKIFLKFNPIHWKITGFLKYCFPSLNHKHEILPITASAVIIITLLPASATTYLAYLHRVPLERLHTIS